MTTTATLQLGHNYAWHNGTELWAGSLGAIHDRIARLYDGLRYHYVPVTELRSAEFVTTEEWLEGLT